MEEYAIIRKPLDPNTGEPFATCSYALFPGLALAQSEPELVVLLYDSLLHQYPDTAMCLCKAPRLLSQWEALGKPTVILATPEDRKIFCDAPDEIPTESLYELLLEHNVTGGCNRELYRLSEPEECGSKEALAELAEQMGVVLSNEPRVPFLTSSMEVRNAMKKQGFDAVHILELIYGMGKSNAHLAHTHVEDHDHDRHEAPKIRDAVMGETERAACEALFDEDMKKRNLQDLHDTLLSLFWGE